MVGMLTVWKLMEDPSVVSWVLVLVSIGNKIEISEVDVGKTIGAHFPGVVTILWEKEGSLNHDKDLISVEFGLLVLWKVWHDPGSKSLLLGMGNLVLLGEDGVWLGSEEIVGLWLHLWTSQPGGDLHTLSLDVLWLNLSGVDELKQFSLGLSDVSNLSVENSGVGIGELSVVIDISNFLLISLLGLSLGLLGLVVLELSLLSLSIGFLEVSGVLLEHGSVFLEGSLVFQHKFSSLRLDGTHLVDLISLLGDFDLKIDRFLLSTELDLVFLVSSSLEGTSLLLLVSVVGKVDSLEDGLDLSLSGNDFLEGHVSGGVDIVFLELLLVHDEILKRAGLEVHGGVSEASLVFGFIVLVLVHADMRSFGVIGDAGDSVAGVF